MSCLTLWIGSPSKGGVCRSYRSRGQFYCVNPRTWGAFHLPGVLRKHHCSQGEWITAAYGNHRGHDESLCSLYFVTNKGHMVGGGRRDRGKSWVSEAPTGIAPKLGTITCWASAGEIEGIVFHWMYGRDR